jgi:hypothetical protein
MTVATVPPLRPILDRALTGAFLRAHLMTPTSPLIRFAALVRCTPIGFRAILNGLYYSGYAVCPC